ncbi:MAG: NAD(+) kinase [Gammaproteobacteria bacterium]|nr:NAD(+) kinase [Gammaproteobacteria bacterium]MCH9744831.1 NAD(+) kinase [Gammaproteobacteria bacterium]
MSTFKNIIIIGRPKIKGVSETLNALKDFLLKRNAKVFAQEQTASIMNAEGLTVIPTRTIPDNADLVIVVGGDGSLLSAAHMAIKHDLPVLGIHHGRLGFLTDIPPDDLKQVADVLDGDYHEEQRSVLSMELIHKQQTLSQGIALNDVVLLPGNTAQMITFETYINSQFVNQQRADGLIIATPTGSTAYALSGGGPILHPKLEAIELVAMFPHTLSSRPLVVPDDSHIEIHLCASNTHSAGISCDGFNRVEVPQESVIHIKKYHQHIHLIHPKEYTYYETLREKLGWERHANRK